MGVKPHTFITLPVFGGNTGVDPTRCLRSPADNMGSNVTVEDAEVLDTFTTDGRGRVNLGKDYKNSEVQLAFAVKDNDPEKNNE